MARKKEIVTKADRLDVLGDVIAHPNTTTKQVALRLAGDDPADLPAIGAIVYNLRMRGMLLDVRERCEHCGRALTRGIKNQPLTVTPKGVRYYEENRGVCV